MEFGLLTIPISLLALLSFASGILIVVRQSTPQCHISECVLATSVLCVLALNAELYLLSFLPVDRPLDGLWLFHSIVTLGLLSLTFYLWGGRVWRATLHELVDSSLVLRRACGSDLVFFSLCLGMLLLVYCVYGAYNVPRRSWETCAG